MGIFDMVSSFLNPQKGYGDAMEQIQKYFQQGMKYQQPFLQAGQNQIGTLTGAENKLLDPAALQSEWSKGYEASPYAQDLMKRSADTGNQEAAAMGLSGSSANLENVQRTGSSIMQQDRQQYLNDLMQKYMTGIGIGQNIFNTGASTAHNMGQMATQTGQEMAGGAFGAANAPGNLLERLIGAGVSAWNKPAAA